MFIEAKAILMHGVLSDKFLAELKNKEFYCEEWRNENGLEIRICITDSNWNSFKHILRKYFNFNKEDKKKL